MFIHFFFHDSQNLEKVEVLIVKRTENCGSLHSGIIPNNYKNKTLICTILWMTLKKNHAERKKCYTKEFILYDSIYVKF